MGKSTVITNLATAIKRRNPHLWVIRIELNDYTAALKASLENDNTGMMDVRKLLDSKQAAKLTNRLEEFVFSLRGKVVLMLDGIDEISPDYTGLVLNILVKCRQDTNFAKIFAATRPHMAGELEMKLGAKPFMLLPFSKEDQVEFLTSYWTHHLALESRADRDRCERYAKALISKMLTWMKEYQQEETNFPGVPLQARMLADIFQESNRWKEPGNWEGCKEYLSTDGLEPKLPEEMNIVRLYEMFIEKKRKVFLDKSNPSGNTAANQALADKFNESLSEHRSLALEVVLGKTKCRLFSSYRENVEVSMTSLMKVGIVQKTNDEWHFIHRTFAEYFVAESLLNELWSNSVTFQKFLIDEVLLNPEYNMVCAFFDGFLQKDVDTLPCSIFQPYQSLEGDIKLTERDKSNLIFRLAEQGCTSILRLIFKCIDFKVIRAKEIAVADLFEADFDEELIDTRRHIFSNTLNMLQYFANQAGVNIKNAEDRTPLHLASLRGYLGMVKFLINQGANIESRDCEGRTPLHVAVYYSNFDVTMFLVEQGANVKSRDKKGHTISYESVIGNQTNIATFLLETILERDGLDVKNSTIPYKAAFLGRLDLLSSLIEKGLNVNDSFEGDQTLISVACLGGQLDAIKYLTQQGADINTTDSDGDTVLHLAALDGQLDIVEFLVTECGLNVNAKNRFVGTALNLAILSGHLDTVKFLVERGGDVHIRDDYEETALHLASLMGRWDIVRFLVVEVGFDINVTNKNGSTPLHLAVSRSHLDTVKFFVDRGADIDATDNSGRTALHSLVRTGRLDTLMTLVLEYKADVDITDNEGRTALHLAAKQGQAHICEFLVHSGADVNVTDSKGLRAPHLAASWGQSDVLKSFVKLGVDVNVRDGRGRTPLHGAASWNRLETFRFLVESGMDVNLGDSTNQTALHLAAERGRLEIAKLLVESGATVDIKDHSGCSALHLATLRGHLNIVRYLVKRGADVRMGENYGRTALHLAALGGHMKAVEFLVDRGVDINARDKKGHTALILADFRANFDIVMFLVECGADCDVELLRVYGEYFSTHSGWSVT